MAKILAAMLSLLLLCSCSYIPSGSTQDLLTAPHLNKRQVALDAALRETLNLQSIIYKYPQTGEFRSPFVFYDLDGDGKEEVIVFYAYAEDAANIRFKVMAEREDNSWYSVHDYPGTGDGDQINFIEFANLLDKERKCMVIGWQNTLRGQFELGVYSYNDKSFTKEILQPYTLWDISDYDKNGLSEITIVSFNGSDAAFGSGYQLSLLAKGLGGGVSNVSAIPLPGDTTAVLQLLHGRLYDGSPAIYLDVLLPGESTVSEIATAIVQVRGNSLESIVGDESMGLFYDTLRDYQDPPSLCADLESDGVVEVPVLQPLGGQTDSEEIAELMLTDYLHLQEEGFESVYSAVVNHVDGYLLFFPEHWKETVTVVRLPEIREWQFFTYDSRADRTEAELLKIQVFSTQDYRDKFTFTENYTLLHQKGQLQYYAYIPEQKEDNPLAVTLREVKEMFRPL